MAHYEKGQYDCQIHSHYFGESKLKKTPFLAFRFTPAGGEYEREVLLYLTPNTVDRAIAILREMGWHGSRFSELDHVRFNGKLVVLDCTHEHSNGNDYDKWDFPRPKSENGSVNDPAVAKKLDALFGSELKKTATAKAAETVPADAGDVEGDDIPF